jgi:homoserine kinase type II
MARPKDSIKIRISPALLKKLLASYNVSFKHFTLAKFGIENVTVFIDNTYALRIYQHRKNRKKIDYELRFMDYLYKLGFPVPKLYRNRYHRIFSTAKIDSKTWHYILMEFINGRHLRRNDFALMPELAKIQAQMHSAALNFAKKNKAKYNTAEGMHYWSMDLIDKARRLDSDTGYLRSKFCNLAEEVTQKFSQVLPALNKLPMGPGHHDYDSDNLIINQNKLVGILDFDDLSYQPFIADLANTLWWWIISNKKLNQTCSLPDISACTASTGHYPLRKSNF